MEHDQAAHAEAVRKIVLRLFIASLDRDQEAAAMAYADALETCPGCVLNAVVGLAQAKAIEAHGSREDAKQWAQDLLLAMQS